MATMFLQNGPVWVSVVKTCVLNDAAVMSVCSLMLGQVSVFYYS